MDIAYRLSSSSTGEVGMRVRNAVCLASTVLMCSGGALGQIVMFNSFGSGDTFSTTTPYVAGQSASTTQVIAAKFTTVSNGTINSVQLALGPTRPAGAQVTIRAQIFGHNATTGLPTSANDPMVAQTITLGAAQIVTFQSATFLETFLGTTGWVVLSVDDAANNGQSVLWNKSPAATGTVATSVNGAAFGSLGSSVAMPAFKVIGEGLNGACCNTATGQCISTGHLACTQWSGFNYFPGFGCSPQRCPAPCTADFDRNGTLAPADIFEFLNAWFAGCP